MTQIEEKSLQVQQELAADMLRLKDNLLYSVGVSAGKLLEVMKSATYPSNVPLSEVMVTFSKNEWDKIKDFLLSCKGNYWGKLDDFSKHAFYELEAKTKIYNKLK